LHSWKICEKAYINYHWSRGFKEIKRRYCPISTHTPGSSVKVHTDRTRFGNATRIFDF
jgi:hypothetical protein